MLDGFPQHVFLCCGFLCAPLYLVSILCLSFRLPRRGLPRPILTTTGYHACVYIPVITPELSRSTIHVHRVITPAISNSYFVVYLLPAFTPPLLLLHHHRAPHVPTYSTRRVQYRPTDEREKITQLRAFWGDAKKTVALQTKFRDKLLGISVGYFCSSKKRGKTNRAQWRELRTLRSIQQRMYAQGCSRLQ